MQTTQRTAVHGKADCQNASKKNVQVILLPALNVKIGHNIKLVLSLN
uniref:Uncharacterized protein n=1 Tax=Anguilla anguilla TaxID=7936 RepID=A0A0E9WXA2_ANGAN